MPTELVDALQQALGPGAPRWLPALLLVVPLAALVEGLVLHRTRRDYDWRAGAASMGDALLRRAVDLVGLSLVAPLAWWLHQHRLMDLPLESAGAWLGLFLGQELCYYAYHRSAHRVRWFWATHAVHHSSNQLTLAAALRLGCTGKLTGTGLFFLPLIWIGWSPLAVGGMVAANLLYQFWLHAAWIPRLGPLEWLFNTPAHHRVHHASNAEYLDCNFGGVLIVFDRLFGTLVEERTDVPPRYGLTTPLHSHHPLHIAFHEWRRLAADLRRTPGWRARLRLLAGPPG